MLCHKCFERLTDPDLVEALDVMEKTLPRRLRDLRESIGHTTREVARDTGMTQATISAYETGKFVPTLPRIVVLAAYYGVTVDYLIWDEKERK